MKRFPALKLVGAFADVAAGDHFLNHYPVDLLFFDINLLDTTESKLIKSLQEKTRVIFTVEKQTFAQNILSLGAFDYLIKPFTVSSFYEAVEKAIKPDVHRKIDYKEYEKHLYVKSEYKIIKIDYNEIEYIECSANYIKLHLSNKKQVMSLLTLKAVLEKLPRHKFIQIHRSYVVPIAKIRFFGTRKIMLNDTELPVSENYIRKIKDIFKG